MAELNETTHKKTRRAGVKNRKPKAKPISNAELENAFAYAGMDPDGQPTFVNIKVKLCDPESKVPEYAHDGDLGRDVVCTSVEYDINMDAYIIHTGLKLETDRNVGCFCMARSGIRKLDAFLTNGVGLVETYIYRGEVVFTFKRRESLDSKAFRYAQAYWNSRSIWKRLFSKERFEDAYTKAFEYESSHALNYAPYAPGDRIGQLVFMVFPETRVEVVDELSETVRGEGGHGSTGL